MPDLDTMRTIWRTCLTGEWNQAEAGVRRSQWKFAVRLAASVLLLTALCPVQRAQTLVRDTSGIPMDNVKDVTNGMQYILKNDDVLMLQLRQDPSSGAVTTYLGSWDSSNSQFTNLQFTPLNGVTPSGYAASSAMASMATGRMFATKSDVVAILNEGDGPAWQTLFVDPLSRWDASLTLTSRFAPHDNLQTQLVMGDFLGNKLADPFVLYLSWAQNGKAEWGMRALAADPASNTTEAPPIMGPELYGSESTSGSAPVVGTAVTGDFNGDGKDEIAILLNDYQTVAFYQVNSDAKGPQFLTISPMTDTNGHAITVKLTTPPLNAQGHVTLVAGRFRNTPNDELVAVGQNSNGVAIYSIQIQTQGNGSTPCPDGTNVCVLQTYTLDSGENPTAVFAQAGPIVSWPQPTYQQLVVGVPHWYAQNSAYNSFIYIGSFTNAFEYVKQSYTDMDANQGEAIQLYSLQLGNFDHQNSDGTHNPKPQLQTYSNRTTGGNNYFDQITTFNINPPDGTVVPPASNAPVTDWLSQYSWINGNQIPSANGNQLLGVVLPGDIQGRSLRLGGPPEIVRFPGQIQPDFVLGMPPMHVDYIAPGLDQTNQADCPPNSTAPCVFNLTFVPVLNNGVQKPFATSLSLSNASTTQGKRTTTTSWGISVKSSVGAKASFNDGLTNASVNIKDSMKAAHDENVAKTYNVWSGTTDQLTVSTGTSDYVFWTNKGMNIYYYPVLGCESDGTNCTSDGSTAPTYVEFSVPDHVSHTGGPVTTQDWYQPIHEPGNIFSYPWSKELLSSQFTDSINPLTEDPQCFLVGGTSQSLYSVTWSKGNGSSVTSGSTNSFSNDLSISTSEGVGVSGIDGADVTSSFDFGASTSFSTLNENSSSQSASTGITVNLPSFNNAIANCCTYYMGGYIFGLNNPHPSAQDLAVYTPDSDAKNPTPVDVATNGPLFAEFMADPVPDGSGMNCGSSDGGNNSWWKGVYSKPDVALNHPGRWNWDPTHQTVTLFPPNPPGAASPSPLKQSFYQMKGFFITKANQSGPTSTITESTAGDLLTLTTRVYNYSLKDTTAPVHVRIYGQLYCSSDSNNETSCINPQTRARCPINSLCGDSFLVGSEQVIPSIPGFKSASTGETGPNWTTAQVNFDTTPYGNSYMVFWVVVWMQDSNGLVGEMPGHGLQYLLAWGAIHNITDVPIEPYSNNVGMYPYQPFHILPSGALPGAAPSGGSLQTISLSTGPQTLLEQRTQLSARLKAAGAPVRHVNIAYYDGDPAKGGALVDVQQIAYMDPGANYAHQAFFTPQSCGVHTLYASAWTGDNAAVQASATTNVTIQPADEVQALITSTQYANFTDATLRAALLALLDTALQDFQQGQTDAGNTTLSAYLQQLRAAGGNGIAADAVNRLTSQASTVLGCGSSGFSLTSSPSSATISAGNSASYVLALTPTGGFHGAVSLSCSGNPQGTACSFSSSQVTLDGSGQVNVTVTVATSARLLAAGMPGGPPSGGSEKIKWFLTLLLTAAAIASLHRARLRQTVLGCLMVGALLLGMNGCGGNGGTATTPSGTYPFTLQATSGNTTRNILLILIVK